MGSHRTEQGMRTAAGEHGAWIAVRPSVHELALLEELSYVRREAQAEADLAYTDWTQWNCADAYAVYRAAQDRADAAQDDLARAVGELAAF